MTEAVVFDMDGLMFDTERLTVSVVAQVEKELGIPGLLSFGRTLVGVNAAVSKRLCFERYGPDFPYDAFIRRKRERTNALIEKNGVPVKPGLMELLRFLKREGIRAAVATSTSRRYALPYLEKAGTTRYFDAVVCGDMLEKSKPDPDIYFKAAAALGVSPAVCMALEDSPNGIRSAHAAGMRTVMVPDLFEPDAQLKELLFACVPTLSDVIRLLRKEKEGAEA